MGWSTSRQACCRLASMQGRAGDGGNRRSIPEAEVALPHGDVGRHVGADRGAVVLLHLRQPAAGAHEVLCDAVACAAQAVRHHQLGAPQVMITAVMPHWCKDLLWYTHSTGSEHSCIMQRAMQEKVA